VVCHAKPTWQVSGSRTAALFSTATSKRTSVSSSVFPSPSTTTSRRSTILSSCADAHGQSITFEVESSNTIDNDNDKEAIPPARGRSLFRTTTVCPSLRPSSLQPLTGKTITFEVESSDTIDNVKDNNRIPPRSPSFGLQHPTLHLVLRLRRRSRAKPSPLKLSPWTPSTM
jgi:hypothetical protein